jgi:hypothetical protein
MKNAKEHKLINLIPNEIKSLVNERTSTADLNVESAYAQLLDPNDFDPINPEIRIKGFGTMTRSALRDEIIKRISGLYNTAQDAASSDTNAYDKYLALRSELSAQSMLMQLINAEITISDELEAMRKKGGRHRIPIPKQT